MRLTAEGGKVREHGFSIVVAMDRNRGIGRDGKLPWKLSGDMKFFKELTTCPDSAAVEERWGLVSGDPPEGETAWADLSARLKSAQKLPEPGTGERNVVVMGRKTWDSLFDEYKPLPGRLNVRLSLVGQSYFIVGKKAGEFIEYPFSGSFDSFFSMSTAPEDFFLKECFVIGGGQIFSRALGLRQLIHLYITEIDAVFDCDTFFPEIPEDFKPVLSSPWISENGVRYRFRRYDLAS